MDPFAEILIGLEIVLAIAGIPLYVYSKRTSRRLYKTHETLQAIAVFILFLAGVAAVMAMYGAGSTEQAIFLQALLPPILTIVLCSIVIYRAGRARLFSRRRYKRH
ncbi:MAG TPA: hypothetical protein PKD04_04375 [Rhodocyclaceae bacterium]|jgi:predicted membrane protein|nr:hypothetical protein [Betaproteobacteria bacterium]HMV00294.1 hypothetical protein [Rhodocyclaceae bacterium]HMV20260.1 hypothetical protein [Rhodocyclaceae bacterium]HMW76512.1 hypothetical protein [Rhodocyclaceae bacterium]HNE43906.1 hypothetical protein [Rhodocyclaceae bacterium]